MKGQATVYQYVLFFTINFTLFLLATGLFRNQLDMFDDQISRNNLKMVNNYISSHIIYIIGCKECETSEIILEPPTTVARRFYGIEGNRNGIKTYLFDLDVFYESSVFKINETIIVSGAAGSGDQKIKLLWNKTDNEIDILRY